MATEVKQSSYREREIKLNPGRNIVEFRDTNPNYIYMNNLGAGTLYLAVNGVPSTTRYDRKVSAYSDGIFAKDVGFKRVEIHCEGTDANSVKIVTFEAPFEPSVLVGATQASGGGGGTTEEVIIKGHTVPLPAGDNNIGRVVVTDMPAQTFILDTLPPGTNNIGKVDVVTAPPLAEGQSHIGKVTVQNAVSIADMPPVIVSDQPVRRKHHVFDGVVSTNLVTFDMTENGTLSEDVNFISYIENEGTSDLFVSFDEDYPTATTGQGKNKQIRLKAGEVISELPRKAGKVHFIRAEGSGNARFLGV